MSREFDECMKERQALLQLQESEGLTYVCAKQTQLFNDLTQDILNPTTPKEAAENLRQARGIIADRFLVPVLLANRLLVLNAKIEKLKPKNPEPNA